ncbi:MAG TPA: hypothetical protein VLS89_04505 [Candidatus Nanopelagicales bacterium]|nr:hypothetical protein [Candidatus Nanopelagicales bacterium]
MEPRDRLDLVREAYSARFGEPFDAEPLLECDCTLLRYWKPGAPAVYASLGSPTAEVTLSRPAPFPGIEVTIIAHVQAAAQLAPLEILRHDIEGTPFEALLIVPPEDGTLVLTGPGGEPLHAFKAVPLTGPELGLWHDTPDRLLGLLRRAGALDGDPLRNCVLEPELTRDFWASQLPALIERTQGKLQRSRARLAQMRERLVPDEIISLEERLLATHEALLSHLQRDRPQTRTPEDAAEERDRRGMALMSYLVDNSVGTMRELLPEEAFVPACDFVTILVVSHPEVQPLFVQAAGEPPARWSAAEALILMMQVVGDDAPQDRKEEALARGAKALADARRTFEPRHGATYEVHVWARMYAAVCEDNYGEPRIERSLANVAKKAQRLESRKDKRKSLRDRLLDICGRLVMSFALNINLGVGGRSEH